MLSRSLTIAHDAFGDYDQLRPVVSISVLVAICGVPSVPVSIARINRKASPPASSSGKADHFPLDKTA